MCTVSFLPLDNGFILTSNRDERALRKPAEFPATYQSNSGTVTFPRDGKAGGTWIAASKTKMICLLNGGFLYRILMEARRGDTQKMTQTRSRPTAPRSGNPM